MKQTLIIVYNANSGKLNALIDTGHKLLSPSTYSCDLCKLTHGVVKPKAAWTNFINNLDMDIVFLHKDELNDFSLNECRLPAILIKSDETIFPVLSADELSTIDNLEKLLLSLQNKLKTNELL